MTEERPKILPPKEKWSPWKSKRMQKFLYYAKFPRGRLIPRVIASTVLYLAIYNTSIYLWKGPDHPLNNVGWYRMKKNGTLPAEYLDKERLVNEFDKEQVLAHSGLIPSGRKLTEATQNRMF